MESSQLEQLGRMSLPARTNHYLKKLIAGEITREQYEHILPVVLRIPYTETVPQFANLDVPSGTEAVEQIPDADLVQGSGVWGEAEPDTTEDTYSSPTEQSREIPLPVVDNADKRKLSQKDKILLLLQDGKWHSTPDIQIAVYGKGHLGSAAIPSRVAELNRPERIIESRPVKRGVWEYRLIPNESMTWIMENIMSG